MSTLRQSNCKLNLYTQSGIHRDEAFYCFLFRSIIVWILIYAIRRTQRVINRTHTHTNKIKISTHGLCVLLFIDCFFSLPFISSTYLLDWCYAFFLSGCLCVQPFMFLLLLFFLLQLSSSIASTVIVLLRCSLIYLLRVSTDRNSFSSSKNQRTSK